MKGDYILPASTVLSLVKDISTAIENALGLAQELTKHPSFEIDMLVDIFLSAFKSFDSQYKQDKYLKETFDIIVSYNIQLIL